MPHPRTSFLRSLRRFWEIHCVWPKPVFAFLTRRICPVLVIFQYVARIIKTKYPRCHKQSSRASASSKKKLSSIIAASLGNSLLLAKKGFCIITRRICSILVLCHYIAWIIEIIKYTRFHKRSSRASASSKNKLSSIIGAFGEYRYFWLKTGYGLLTGKIYSILVIF